MLNKICEHNNLRVNFAISSFFSAIRMLFLISMLASLNVYFFFFVFNFNIFHFSCIAHLRIEIQRSALGGSWRVF